MSHPPHISEAEWDVMQVLWDLEEAPAKDVVSALAGRRDWSARTVKTLLARLVKKGCLGFRTEGKRYFYRPSVTREECVRAESRSFLERVFGGALSPMLTTFVREAELSDEELAELKRLLDEELGKR